jgi:AraC-like DNA-binding protein
MPTLPDSLIGLPARKPGAVCDMEALEDLLRAMRLSGAVFMDAEFTAPWCVRAKISADHCRPFMPVPGHLIAYHYVLEGTLWVRIDGEPACEAVAGELLVLPRNDTHVLGNDLNLRPRPANHLIEPATDEGLARIRYGGGGARCRILCGFLGTEDRTDPLIASLPAILKLSLDAGRMGSWIEASMRYAARELAAGSPGAATSQARLSELLFAEAVRTYVGSLPPRSKGWLAGLRDPYVGRALALIHSRSAHPLMLDELAREVGLSRSALGERFVRHIGMSPMRYHSRRRLQHAADRLRHSKVPVSQIAYEIGYESDAAFSRSFKREFGTSPAAFRETGRPLGAVPKGSGRSAGKAYL